MYGSPNVEERFSGRWVDVAVTTDLGEVGETNEFLNRLHGDITISKDSDDDEYQFNTHRYTVSSEGHITREIEITLTPSKDNADLETLGLIDAEGKEVPNVFVPAVRLVIWAEPEETDELQAIHRAGEDVRVAINDTEFSDGPAEITLTLHVMGAWHYDPPAMPA